MTRKPLSLSEIRRIVKRTLRREQRESEEESIRKAKKVAGHLVKRSLNKRHKPCAIELGYEAEAKHIRRRPAV